MNTIEYASIETLRVIYIETFGIFYPFVNADILERETDFRFFSILRKSYSRL